MELSFIHGIWICILMYQVGLGISQRNADSQRNPVYNASHQIFFLKTKRFVCSSVNVILMRQTCGQRSSWAVESKRRAPDNYFPEWIAISFQSQNVKETEISVGALFGYLQKKNCCTMPISNFFCGRNMFFSEVVIAQRFSFRKYPKSARPRC